VGTWCNHYTVMEWKDPCADDRLYADVTEPLVRARGGGGSGQGTPAGARRRTTTAPCPGTTPCRGTITPCRADSLEGSRPRSADDSTTCQLAERIACLEKDVAAKTSEIDSLREQVCTTRLILLA